MPWSGRLYCTYLVKAPLRTHISSLIFRKMVRHDRHSSPDNTETTSRGVPGSPWPTSRTHCDPVVLASARHADLAKRWYHLGDLRHRGDPSRVEFLEQAFLRCRPGKGFQGVCPSAHGVRADCR